MTIFYFIIGLGLLIFIHELGHFLVAKLSGIRVERFSLGFGPRIGFKWGETEYCISALPLGGYVKMSGQEDFEEEKIAPLDDPRAFSSKSLWTRLKVVLAGPGMNLLLPFILMPLVFMIGRHEPKYLREEPVVLGVEAASTAEKGQILPGDRILQVDGQNVTNWEEALKRLFNLRGESVTLHVKRGEEFFLIRLNPPEDKAQGSWGIEPALFVDAEPLVGGFSKDSAAQAAGMKENDLVLSINGEPVLDWKNMSEKVNASGGKPLKFRVQRGGEVVEMTITPQFNPNVEKYVIGVSKGSNPVHYETHRYGFIDAMKKGFQENVMLFGLTFKVLKDLVTLKASIKELGGPIKIAEISAKAAEQGLGNFLFLLSFLSIQLGILNLLPIPVLDGGHVLFMAYEGIAKKPLSMKKRLIAQQVGMFLLLTLMVVVTINDIDSVWGFKHLLEKLKSWF